MKLCPLNVIVKELDTAGVGYVYEIESELLTRWIEFYSELDQVTTKTEAMRSTLKKNSSQ